MSTDKKILILYHANCNDGFTAAWLYRKYRLEVLSSQTEMVFYPVSYGNPFVFEMPEFWTVAGEKTEFVGIIILDFSYPRETMEMIARRVEKGEFEFFGCYDHHKTAEAACKGVPGCVFDSSQCASAIVNSLLLQQQIPLVDYINDHDLYLHQQPHSLEIKRYLSIVDHNFESWGAVAHCVEHLFDEAVKIGAVIQCAHAKAIERHTKETILIRIGEYDNIPLVNCSDKDLISDLGHVLSKEHPFSVSFRFRPGLAKPWIFSLRSEENGVDVSMIAKDFGGGGHKHAAGFSLSSLSEIGLI